MAFFIIIPITIHFIIHSRGLHIFLFDFLPLSHFHFPPLYLPFLVDESIIVSLCPPITVHILKTLSNSKGPCQFRIQIFLLYEATPHIVRFLLPIQSIGISFLLVSISHDAESSTTTIISNRRVHFAPPC